MFIYEARIENWGKECLGEMQELKIGRKNVYIRCKNEQIPAYITTTGAGANVKKKTKKKLYERWLSEGKAKQGEMVYKERVIHCRQIKI